MDIQGILKFLPHRFPFLLVDRVKELEPGKHIVAMKNVSINEPYFCGHFPHYPVMPGVLIVEALAQAAGILSFKTMGDAPDEKSLYFFVGIDKARFKAPVVPGDQLELRVEIVRQMRGIWKYNGTALVGGEVVCEAELMCAKRDIPANDSQ
ncbi:3-hydroxyacyl-ACP dehydratase FabZ [Chitinimonas sp. DQS-5]|uniref:3-hydroxyacyl-[acyl-carrier-protein] dehydratase FabZ n=1 Tax=Parachitinimonas caeni TaxID=3031301 RepID=A0ABT7DX31_9NEIS|nr:3-hydroxyacyl-ACP dehydratase FabZ [Parachitinimonas caeni]